MIILGIETSCDETGIALYCSEQGLLSHALHSQIELHKDYGGVVPELASRDHIARVLPLIQQVLDEAKLDKSNIDGIAYTQGPGLMGALFVGAMAGRALAYALDIPAIGVHHMEGHLLAPLLEESAPAFPFVALLVSGGHTQLIKVEGIGDYEILGESLDDAAGEAFDKAAKMLGLSYPGGPAIAKLAEQGRPGIYRFPRPMTEKPGLNFSFSGLKTFCLNTLIEQANNGSSQQKIKLEGVDTQIKADIAYAFQEAVVETLRLKCLRALKQTNCKRLVMAGGVSANSLLRERMHTAMQKINGEVFYPRLEFCTDNGAMIAYAGCQRLLAGESQGLGVKASPRWSMETLPKLSSNAGVQNS